jgi:glycosyltransferase involved in cell wall biosynthesis
VDLKNSPKLAEGEEADIAFVLEGTYPFIRGGVSSWVHQLIVGLPQYTFALVFLGDRAENYTEMKYELPDNVVDLSLFFIMEEGNPPQMKAHKGNKNLFVKIKQMHNSFQNNSDIDFGKIIRMLIKGSAKHEPIKRADFLYSEEAWDFISKQYEKNTADSSFLSYFWTIRVLHIPIFVLLDAVKKIPKAKVYHTVSTGYAGLFSAMIQSVTEKPIILTEHGIYTKERKIELSQVSWINDAQEKFGAGLNEDFSYLRQLWIRFFETIGDITYQAADPIITITEGNRRRQISDGANSEKVSVIPNGVDLHRFKGVRDSRPKKPPLVIGFIGRVVPIKDVKTFYRAIRSVTDQLPNIEAWIIGGEDEDPKYATECRDLMSSLGLEEVIVYKGFCDVAAVMADVGVVALSSISEGLPLVILEAFASGRPCVATDVGACKELIEGATEEDKALGAAGGVVDIADSEGLADEMIKLLVDADYWHQACTSAVNRVEKYFNEEGLFESYEQVYRSALEK